MDHGLRSERAHFRGHCRPAIGYNPRRQSEVSLGAALANKHSRSGGLRSSASSRAVETNWLANCAANSDLRIRLDRVSPYRIHNRNNLWVGRCSAEPHFAPKTEQNLLKVDSG